MAFYKYFWDLANSTTFADHTVGSFDNNTTTGGGDFKWVSNANNTLVNNIPGVRIKPTSSTNGYWQRVAEGPVCVDWFGPQNTSTAPYTFAQLGVSQNTLNNRYGVSFVNTSDTYDTAAVKYAMYYMGNLASENSVQFEPKLYWLTKPIDLPRVNTNASGLPGVGGQGKFIIDGNGATISTYGSGAPFDVFRRIPTSQTDADTLINYSIVFKNFSATSWGASWVNSGYSFLFLGASANAVIDNINIVNYDIGIRLEYCPNATVKNVFTSNVKTRSVYIKSGSWFGASLTNSNSNNVAVYQMQVEDSNSQTAALSFAGVNNAVVSQFWLKGLGTPSYGIWWDSLDNNEAYNLRIMDTYITTNTSVAGLYLKMQDGGMAIIDGLYNDSTQTVVATEMYSGTGDMYFSNSTVWPVGSKMSNVGTVKWDFKAVNFGPGITTPADIVNPLNNLWVTAGPPAIPSVSNVTNQPAGSAQLISLQQVLDYDHTIGNGLIFLGTDAGDGSTGTPEVVGIGTESAQNNTGNYVSAVGYIAAKGNTGDTVVAIGSGAAVNNAGNHVVALENACTGNAGNYTIGIMDGASDTNSGNYTIGIGYLAANNNTGASDVIGIGRSSSQNNSATGAIGIGFSTNSNNSGSNTISIGNSSGSGNTGSSAILIGQTVGGNNTGNNVIALGANAGANNTLSSSVIISNTCLPSYANFAAAAAVIIAPAATSGTYLYHDQATNSIGAVRIP